MRVSSFDEYRALEGNELVNDHDLIPPDFPHVVMVECDYPDLNVAIRWCWKCFGPEHGECRTYSEYPACPIILATERQGVRGGPDGKVYKIKEYDRDVAPHTHTGKWLAEFLEKTDYDHGFAQFCFQVEADSAKFVQQVPSFDWGENYPWLIEE